MALDPRDPRVQRLLRERELVAESETRAEEERLAKRVRIAEAMGLSEEEKQDYIAKEAPNLRTKINESSITQQPMTSETTPSPTATLSAMKDTAALPTTIQPIGMGPFASGEKYGSLLDRLKEAEVEAPTGKPKTLAAALGAAPGSKGPEIEPQAAPTPSPYETEMSRLKEERATAKEEQQTEMDRLAKGELASLIGRSLTQIGAAATGMQKGIDMSGVAQKELVDWDKRRALVASQYEQRVKELEADRARLERVKERTDDRAERAAIATRQEALAKEERAFKAKEAAKDREIKEGIALLKAYKDKDEAAIKKIQGKATLEAKQIDREIAALDKIDGMFELYDVASGNKKTQQEAKIRQALRTQMGPEAVAGEKKSFLGFEYDDKKSVDQIIEDVAKYKQDLQRSRDTQEQLSLGLEEQAAPALQAPTAAVTPAAPATGMVTVELDGKRGQVPASGIEAFKKKYPGAKVVQ